MKAAEKILRSGAWKRCKSAQVARPRQAVARPKGSISIMHFSSNEAIEKRNFHSTTLAKAKNLSRDTRMAGRRRFYKDVGIKPISPPWTDFVDDPLAQTQTVDNPISAGVDGTKSATNISLQKPTQKSLEMYLTPSQSDSSKEIQWYGVTLDGRLLKTPMGTTLSIPSLPLALSIASEWDDQEHSIQPAQMPLMTLVCTTIDQFTVPSVRDAIIQDLLRYLRNDTTCYWADATEDRILYRKQSKFWKDLHEWIDCEKKGLGEKPAVAMGAGEGLIMSRRREQKTFAGLPHSDLVMDNAEKFLQGCDSWTLTAVQSVTMEAKSFLVGLAVVRGVDGWLDLLLEDGEDKKQQKKNPFWKDAKKAVMASRVEEEFQIDNWGLVEGGHDYDRLNCSIQIHAATSLLQCIAFENAGGVNVE